MAESHAEDRKYLCRFDPRNEILKPLYEIFEKSKKQDLTPWFVTPWFGPHGLLVGLINRAPTKTLVDLINKIMMQIFFFNLK